VFCSELLLSEAFCSEVFCAWKCFFVYVVFDRSYNDILSK